MITYKLTCPSCTSRLKSAKPVPAGRVVKCPKCRHDFPAPAVKINIPASNNPALKAEERSPEKRGPGLFWGMVASAAFIAVSVGIWWTKSHSISQGARTTKAQSSQLKAVESFPKNGSIVQVPIPLQETEAAPPKAEPVPMSVKVEPEAGEIRRDANSAANSKIATPKDAEAPAKDETIKVLVSGNPPLTQDFLDQLTAYGEWLLDIQMTPPQRQEWQQLFVNTWKKADPKSKESFLANAQPQLKWYGEISKLTDEQRREIRARQQPWFVATLKKASNPEDRFLLTLYETGHRPGGDRNPILVAGTTPLAQDTLDKSRMFSEWLLDVGLTDRQRQEFQQLFINDWKKLPQASKEIAIKGAVEGWPSQLPMLNNYDRNLLRAQLQPQFLASLEQNPRHELSRWLLEVYQSAHKLDGERNHVLVPGKTPLTESIVSQYGDFIEWILALKMSGGLTDAQRQDLRQVLMSDWQKIDQAEKDSFLRLLKRWNAVAQLDDAARSQLHQQLQPQFLAHLVSTPDHEPSRWLLEIYDREQKLVRLYAKELQTQKTHPKKSSG